MSRHAGPKQTGTPSNQSTAATDEETACRAARPSRPSGTIKGVSIGVIVLSLLVMARSLPLEQAIRALQGWFDSLGIWGPLVFAGLYVLATVLFLPGSVLTAAAGLFFGLLWGTVSVSAGSTIGAALAFLIARYVARDAVARKVRRFPKFEAVDRALAEGGWKVVALLRLSPAVPFNLQNYLYGLTALRFWPTVITSWLTMLPGTVMYVYFGYLTREGVAAAAGVETATGTARWIFIGLGLVATVGLAVYVTRVAQRKLREMTDIVTAAEESPRTDTELGPSRRGRPQGTFLLATVAVLSGTAAACSIWKRDALASLFGPPQVTLREVHSESGGTFDHSALDDLLRRHVDADGWVDYEGLLLKADRLGLYLKSLENAPFDQLARNEKLALLINAYNAFTLRLILDHWDKGALASIHDIPRDKRWKDVRWNVGGSLWSLDQIEHEQIRPKFEEPRIHFALVCAAVGCPPLRNEVFVGTRIDQQLEAQTRYVHSHRTWFRFDKETKTARLTPLYKWYGHDFEQVSDSVLDYLAQYVPEIREALKQDAAVKIEWLDYDWRLNSTENRQAR